MRLGNRRGMLVAALAIGALAAAGPAEAGSWFGLRHTIPREVLAQDYRSGQVYMAPPIPNGLYAKDDYVGCIHEAMAHVHGMIGKLCAHCHGKGCGACGGQGCLHGDPCGSCGGKGCGHCGGKGLFAHHGANCSACAGLGAGTVMGDPGVGMAGYGGHGHGGGVCADPACGMCGAGVPSGQVMMMAPAAASPQAAVPACGGCGKAGCGFCGGLGSGLGHHAAGGKHGLGLGGHGHGLGLGGGHGHGNGVVMGGAGCGDPGCGICGGGGGHGLGLGHHGKGDPGCKHCGGKGCGHCSGLFDHHLLKSGLNHFFGPKVEYFVGPGGPVPLTPGYVPYVNPVRSPRDFFAFPPFVDQAF